MEQEPKQSSKGVDKDLILDLNFVPQWARKPPGTNPYGEEYSGAEDERRGSRSRRHDRGRREHSSRDRHRSGGGQRPRDSRSPRAPGDHRPHGDHRDARGPRRERRESHPPAERLPLEIHFIPERKRIGAVVREVHKTARAYPLMGLASLFLGQPEHYLVKIEVRRHAAGADGLRFYQCRVCRAAFRSKEEAVSHLLAKHVDELYHSEEIEVDPPSGNFTCVGRCSISGELLGPPNYHGYNERLTELHQQRFAHMPIEEYRTRIEVLHDEELIAQWKEAQKHQRVYWPKGGEEPEQKMTRREMETHFAEQVVPKKITEGTRVVMPAPILHSISDRAIKGAVRSAWNRESRYPLTLSLALRPAFRHMRLYLFKTGKETFVTGIQPHPIDPEQAIPVIAELLSYLAEHPGCTRPQLVEALRPGKSSEDSEVQELLKQIHWLVEKGHLVEFFNGTLSVPSRLKR